MCDERTLGPTTLSSINLDDSISSGSVGIVSRMETHVDTLSCSRYVQPRHTLVYDGERPCNSGDSRQSE